MLVEMLKTEKGSIDGVTISVFEEGELYNIPESLANAFIDLGWAREYDNIPETPEEELVEMETPDVDEEV